MNLIHFLSVGTRCLTLCCTVWSFATCPSAAQLPPALNFLHVDPIEGFEDLTIEPILPIATTFETCLANPDATFTTRTRGGLADDPTQPLRDRTLWRDLRPLDDTTELSSSDESESVAVEASPLTDPADGDFQKCQTLFDNR